MRFTTIIPLILSIAGFVLAMLTLFTGSKPGQMEDFHIIAVCAYTLPTYTHITKLTKLQD
jgi:hypothetical protein